MTKTARYLNPIPNSSARTHPSGLYLRQCRSCNVQRDHEAKSGDCALRRERAIAFVYSLPRTLFLVTALVLFSALIVPAWSEDRGEKENRSQSRLRGNKTKSRFLSPLYSSTWGVLDPSHVHVNVKISIVPTKSINFFRHLSLVFKNGKNVSR